MYHTTVLVQTPTDPMPQVVAHDGGTIAIRFDRTTASFSLVLSPDADHSGVSMLLDFAAALTDAADRIAAEVAA